MRRATQRGSSILPSLTHLSQRGMEFPDYHPKDLRHYHLTEEEAYALEKMDNLADIPFPQDELPGFSAAPRYLTETIMKDEWSEYLIKRIQDMEDPGPVFDPYARFNKKPDPDTEPDATIVGTVFVCTECVMHIGGEVIGVMACFVVCRYQRSGGGPEAEARCAVCGVGRI